MDLFSYRLIFHLIFIIFLYSCEETIDHDDEPDIDESSNFSIMGFSVNYDDNNDIDPNKIKLIGRLGGKWYCKGFDQALFTIEKPI